MQPMFGARDSDGAYLSLDHPHIPGNRFNTDVISLVLRQNITSFYNILPRLDLVTCDLFRTDPHPIPDV